MEDIIDFYKAIEKLKHTHRRGWLKRKIPDAKDTIASHSYGATLIGWILAKENNLDVNKVIKLLLIHDLVMAYVPDYTPQEPEYKNKQEIENKAITKLLKALPDSLQEEFVAHFKEYQEAKTEEAQIAREADKLETVLQAHIYSKKTGTDHQSEFISAYKKYIKSHTGIKLISVIETSI